RRPGAGPAGHPPPPGGGGGAGRPGRGRGAPPPPAEEIGTAARVTVLPATVVKGLEYDHVVVVEPAAIVESEPHGLHRLYVVLTRAVSRLDVLHARPLPEPLADRSPAAGGA
ncbi:hypothetical protein ACFVIN_23435, partial [Streptomyces prasinus]